MADHVEATVTPLVATNPEPAQTPPPTVSPFARAAWSDTPPEIKSEEPIKKEEGAAATTTATATTTTTAAPVEIPVPIDWLKKEFEIEDPAILKAEREEYKKLKATPPVSEYKFENEESKRMAEAISKGDRKTILKILETQDKIESFVSAEVNDDTAADIIKLGMQLKYKDLSPKEIEYKFNKEYGIPREPVKKDDELDEDFNMRKEEWKEKVDDIKMNRNIEAKLAKPELEKLKSTIVLPEIQQAAAQANEPTAEQLAKVETLRKNFLEKLGSDYAKIEGFTTRVKDESVDFPVSFKIPDEAKVAIKTRLEDGMDIQKYVDGRWFNEGNPKIEQIMADIYVWENLDKILSGVATNSASERLIAYRKQIGNVNVSGNGFQQTFNSQDNGGSNASPFKKEAWTETPPVSFNN